MASKVYYAPARVEHWDYNASQAAGLERLIDQMGFSDSFEKNEVVLIKTHFGSYGAHRIVRPRFLRMLVDAVKAVGGKPVVCDTVRIDGWDYLDVASQNGINALSMGCPVVLADGLLGFDSVEVESGPVLGKVAMASLVHDATAMIVVSHFKGHIGAGFGGAVKNLAMGGVAGRHRSGEWQKARGHLHACGADASLTRDAELCTMCLQCLHVCPTEAITEENGTLLVDDKKCWRCGRCERVCPDGAIKLAKREQADFMAGLAEAAAAVVRTFADNKILYFNFALEVQPECDCMPMADTPLVQDQGIFASRDIVAVDQAALDMVNQAKPLPESLAEEMKVKHGEKILTASLGVDGQPQLDELAVLGIGRKEYELVRV